jgi:inositol polyphosphate 5-phosphatase INPP5B/F
MEWYHEGETLAEDCWAGSGDGAAATTTKATKTPGTMTMMMANTAAAANASATKASAAHPLRHADADTDADGSHGDGRDGSAAGENAPPNLLDVDVDAQGKTLEFAAPSFRDAVLDEFDAANYASFKTPPASLSGSALSLSSPTAGAASSPTATASALSTPRNMSTPSSLLRLLPRDQTPQAARTPWDDDTAADLDIIGVSLGLSLDEESKLLSTPEGCREWIRKEMLRREKDFTKMTTLSIWAGTWNVNGKKPSVDIREWLLPAGSSLKRAADVFLIGLQEVQPLSGMSAVTTDPARGTVWKGGIERALDSPNTYVTIAARQLVGILLVVLVKRTHEPFVRDLMITDAGTGFLGSGGNKGGVACRFALYDKTIACVSCHFAAHEQNTERRNQDFHDVVRKAIFRREPGAKSDPSPFSYLEYDRTSREAAGNVAHPMSILDHDAVFWTGDLNYRIQLPVDHALEFIQRRKWEELLKHDQLLNAMSNGEVFQGFEEGLLNFAPTYKFERQQNEYEKDKEDGLVKRTPSWTDRVLWRDRVRSSPRSSAGLKSLSGLQGGVKLRRYERHEVLSSDHRPVNAVFTMEFRVINIKSRNNVVRKLHDQLARRENALRPRLSASSTSVDLGPVEFGRLAQATVPITLRNEGRVTAFISVKTEDFPAWLSLDGNLSSSLYPLGPGQTAIIGFQAFVTSRMGISSALNQQTALLQSTVRLVIQGVNELAVAVSGTYIPSCLGNTLTQLAAHPKPFVPRDLPSVIASFASDNATAVRSEESTSSTRNDVASQRSLWAHRNLPVPKEIWRVVDFLVHVGTPQCQGLSSAVGPITLDPSIFLPNLETDSYSNVLSSLNSGEPIPAKTEAAAAATCLLKLLQSLEEPVVPFSNYIACVELGSNPVGTRKAVDVFGALRGAPAVNVNTLVYLSSFLGQLDSVEWALNENSNSTSRITDKSAVHVAESLCRTFGPILLAPSRVQIESMDIPVENAAVDLTNLVHIEERSNFLRHLVHACKDDLIVNVDI